MTISREGALQLFIVLPAKRFTESIKQNYREESLLQIISDAYDHSHDASQDENRNHDPHFRYPDAQTLKMQKVVSCPGILEAPASPCNEHDYHQWWDPGTMSLTEILFATPDIQKASESGDATDALGDAQDVPMDEDSALDKEGDVYAAADLEDDLVFETILQSPMTNRTKGKSRKVIIADPLMSSDSLRTTRLARSQTNISVQAQLRQVLVDIPINSDETQICS
jgi:hypothetical protein